METVGDSIVLDPALLSVFLLVLCRVGGWVVVTPLLGSRGTASVGRIALSVSLAFVLTIPASGNAVVPESLGLFVQAAIVQFLFGAAFGFLTGLFLYVAGMAGSLVDLMSGLGYASVVDPASGQQAAVFSRLFSITFLALLFATGAYLTIIYGLGRTFEVVPIAPWVPFDTASIDVVTAAVGGIMRAMVEVASPLLGILLLTEVALAVAARFFPQANVAFLGLGLKALLALLGASAVLILLPPRIDGFLAAGLAAAEGVFR